MNVLTRIFAQIRYRHHIKRTKAKLVSSMDVYEKNQERIQTIKTLIKKEKI